MQIPKKSPPWLYKAITYLGQSEVAGTKHNPIIVKFSQRLGLLIRDDETPWCATFVGSCLEEACIRSTRSALALSYRNYGIELGGPVIGAIAYMTRKNKAGKIIGGHVGFVMGLRSDGAIMLLGGNQGDKVSIAAFPKSRIIGYRWPHKTPVPYDNLMSFALNGTPTFSEKED